MDEFGIEAMEICQENLCTWGAARLPVPFTCQGIWVAAKVYCPPRMQNQMENKMKEMEIEMETE